LSLDPETRALLRELEANRERIERLLDGEEISDGGTGGQASEGSDDSAHDEK
jgi:hypothetical protein